MYDGAELAKAIAANPDAVEAALIAYERDPFPRSAAIAVDANGMLNYSSATTRLKVCLIFFASYQPAK